MTVAPGQDLERQDPRAATEAVTLSFADPSAGTRGTFRLGVDPDGRASVFAVLFEGREPVAAQARGDLEAGGKPWAALEAAGLRMEVAAPLERWTLEWRGDGAHVRLEAEATSAAAAMPPVGGLEGYEQLCRVHGSVEIGGRRSAVEALGQRGHLWGTPDWDRLELTRSVSVWLGGGDGAVLAAARPAGARGHEEEAPWACTLRAGEPTDVAEARLSTTYDGDGHQRRAGLELWPPGDEAYAERIAGEVLCGSTLDLGPLRLDVAFFAWHADGRDGVGRYDLLRRA